MLREAGSDENTVYYYDMGPEHFLVPEKAFRALVPASGTRCRVYYLASPKTLLSVEVLEAPLR